MRDRQLLAMNGGQQRRRFLIERLKESSESLRENVIQQRERPARSRNDRSRKLADAYSRMWGAWARMWAILNDAYFSVPYCKCLYASDTNVAQIALNISREGLVVGLVRRDRSGCPCTREALWAAGG